MTNTSRQLCPECTEAEKKQKLDIQCVLDKLESENQVKLSASETRYLCASLCLFSSYQVACLVSENRMPTLEELNRPNPEMKRKTRNLSSQMSDKVHFYVKELMGIQDANKRIPPWSQVVLFFQKQGCKKNELSSNLQKLQKSRYLFIFRIVGTKSPNEISQALRQIGIEVETIERLENAE